MGPVWSRSFRYWVLTLMVVAAGFALWYLRPVFPSLVIAALLAYIINPLADRLEASGRIPRPVSLLLVMLLVMLVLIGLPALFWPWVREQVQALTRDVQNLVQAIDAFLSRPVDLLGYQIQLNVFMPELDQLPAEITGWVTEGAFTLVESITTNTLWLLVILVTTYYLVKDWDRLRENLFQMFPQEYQGDAQLLYGQVVSVWSGYLKGNLALMLVVGIGFTVAWLALGVPGAILLGVLAGLLTVIPDLGPAIAAGVAMLVGLVEGSIYLDISNFWFMVLIFTVYMVLINVKNIFIRPRLFGRSVHMHEGVVFVAIIAAIFLQGILGALIVVPVLGSLGVISRYMWRQVLGLPGFPPDEPDEHPFPPPPIPERFQTTPRLPRFRRDVEDPGADAADPAPEETAPGESSRSD